VTDAIGSPRPQAQTGFVKHLLLAALLLLPLSASHAALVARTDDFPISETTASAARPAVTTDADGNFVVVWQTTPTDPPGQHIYARRFDAAGAPLGPELRLDAAVDEYREDAALACGADGALLVTWRVANPAERPRIGARRLDATGSPLGDEFQINSERAIVEAEYVLGSPSVSAIGSDFVVVWSSGTYQYGYFISYLVTDVYGRRVGDSGPSALDFRVSTLEYPDAWSQDDAEVAAVPDGFVVVWAEGYFSGFDSDVRTRARRFDTSGNAVGSELVVGDEGVVGPQVAVDSTGGFTVVWPTWRLVDYPIPSDVAARTFAADGTPLAGEFFVSGPTPPNFGYQDNYAGVHGTDAASTDAGFVVVWSSGSSYWDVGGSNDGSGIGLFHRDFTTAGDALGIEKQVNAGTSGDQRRPAMACNADGRCLLVWESVNLIVGRVFELLARSCGDVNEDDALSAADALATLLAAVGVSDCEPCTCDADGSTSIAARDALMLLKKAVGEAVTLACAPCAVASARRR
jgi:hypothetical protein